MSKSTKKSTSKNKDLKNRGPRQRKKAAQTRTQSGSSGLSRNQWIGLGAMLLVVFLAYLPVMQADFINYDDDLYITENHLIQNPSGENVKTLFADYFQNQYSPVAMLIMAAEMKIFGGNVAILKFISILLHLACTLLVFQLIRALFNRYDYALITAGLFGLHTLQVESVAWLTASMKIGAFALFSLASVLAYVYYLDRKKTGLYVASLVLFLLSCFSKEQAIALVAVLPAIDYLRGRALLSRSVLLEKAPFLLIGLIFAFVTLGISSEMQNERMANYWSFFDRLIFSFYAFAFYMVKLILPVNLSAFYTYPLKDAIPAYYYISPIVGIGALYALYYFWKKDNRLVVFGILFFLIHIALPMLSQIMSVRDTMMADRYLYLPAIGAFLMLAYALMGWGQKKPGLKNAIWGGLAAYGLLLAILTYQRSAVWDNSITIFSDVIEKGKAEQGKFNPFLSIAYNNRGNALKENGNVDAAFTDYNEGLRQDPNSYDLYNNRGIVYKERRDMNQALADYNKSIELKPDYDKAYVNRGNVYFETQQYDQAVADYAKALELNPRNAFAYSARGAVYAMQGQLDRALEEFNQAIRYNRNMKDAYRNRALTYYNLKRYNEALADIDRYLSLDPNNQGMINLRQEVTAAMR